MPKNKNVEFPNGIELVTGLFIRNKKNAFLFVRSPKWHKKWVLPGGHIEPGESIMDSAIREGQEETGLKLAPIKILGFEELVNCPDFYRPAHFISFKCLLETDGDNVYLEKRELTEYQWLTSEKALTENLSNTGIRKTLQELINAHP